MLCLWFRSFSSTKCIGVEFPIQENDNQRFSDTNVFGQNNILTRFLWGHDTFFTLFWNKYFFSFLFSWIPKVLDKFFSDIDQFCQAKFIVYSSVPVELGVGFTFPSNNNNKKNPHIISQLLLAPFWPYFKSRYLETSRTDLSVTVTFVQATFLLGTFVHISNIWALTDLILTKLLGSNFLGVSIFVDTGWS